MTIRGRYPNLMKDQNWLVWKEQHWNDPVFADARRQKARLVTLKKTVASGNANAKSWAIREGRETLSKMMTEEDKIYHGYYLPRRDKVRAMTLPGSQERIFTQVGGSLIEMDHSDWRDPFGPGACGGKPVGPQIGPRDGSGPGRALANGLGDSSWEPSSEFVGDLVEEDTKEKLYTVGLVGFAVIVGGVVLFDLATAKTRKKLFSMIRKK
jgi:hypothetical protein